jgi:hypothetical protein
MGSYHFITFGNTKYQKSVKRICLEAEKIAVFDKVTGYGEEELFSFSEFEQHRNFVYSNSRGFGYWLWKSFLTMKYIETMNEGDILVYADAGCTIQEKGRKRILEYFDMVKNHGSGILGFALPQIEKRWTKMDLVQHLNAGKYLENFHLTATTFVLRNCENTRNLVKMWYETGCNYSLIDDSPSNLPNDPSFIEHRHDQSIFSLLRKKYGCVIIPEEVESTNEYFPICATRKV